MFNKGSEVTTTILTNFFKKIYNKINGVTNVPVMSTGQILTRMEYDSVATGFAGPSGVKIVMEPMNVWGEQYFDSWREPLYFSLVDGFANTHGGDDYLQDLIDEIEVLQNR